MLLFQKRFHEGLVSGAVDVTFRRWDKPHVRPGGRYRCHPIGVLEVTAVSRARVSDLTDVDARRSGFESRAVLVQYLGEGPGGEIDDATELFRVELKHGGDGDRVEIALDDTLSADDVAVLKKRLERLDGDAWTKKTMALIDANPRVAASKLAAKVGRDTAPFKVDVRKLKKLGLTQSFEVGYEISPRGRAYLDATKPKKRAR